MFYCFVLVLLCNLWKQSPRGLYFQILPMFLMSDRKQSPWWTVGEEKIQLLLKTNVKFHNWNMLFYIKMFSTKDIHKIGILQWIDCQQHDANPLFIFLMLCSQNKYINYIIERPPFAPLFWSLYNQRLLPPRCAWDLVGHLADLIAHLSSSLYPISAYHQNRTHCERPCSAFISC